MCAMNRIIPGISSLVQCFKTGLQFGEADVKMIVLQQCAAVIAIYNKDEPQMFRITGLGLPRHRYPGFEIQANNNIQLLLG